MRIEKIVRLRAMRTALLATVGVSLCGYAQTADQLKSRFATLLGANKYARIVWQRQGSGLPNMFGTAANKIMAMDTKDGIVRELVATTGYKSDATFTWDGKRVIYYNNSSEEVWVIDFLGQNSNHKKILTGYTGGGHCWRSTDGKDYVLAVSGVSLYRINIDNTAEKTLVYTGTSGGDGSGTSWASLSPDGKYLAAAFPQYPDVGIFTVGGSLRKFSPGGCWPTIARDATHDVLYTIEPHTNIRIVNSSGGEVLNKNLGSAIHHDGGADEYECLRWTPERDFCTLISFNEAANTCRGIPNPKLVKISTLQFAAVVDNPAGSEGNTDVFFYTSGTDPTGIDAAARRMSSPRIPAAVGPGRAFDSRGRTVPLERIDHSGVYLTATAGNAKVTKRSANVRFAH